MGLLNPSFEDEGTAPGLAEHWTLTSAVAHQQIAGFGPEPLRAWEDFERWSVSLTTLDEVPVARAFFDEDSEGYEDFTRGWSNDLYLVELPTGYVAAANFAGEAVETMEVGWSNDNFATSWVVLDVAPALFDGLPAEDFEAGWRDNELYASSWSEIVAQGAAFAGGGNVETFGASWASSTSL